jgi:hypothetical protein
LFGVFEAAAMSLRGTTKHENGVIVIPSETERSGVESRNLAHTGTRFLDSLRSLEMTWERLFIFEAAVMSLRGTTKRENPQQVEESGVPNLFGVFVVETRF